MALIARVGDVPEVVAQMEVTGGALNTRQAFGLESSLMVARRTAGYHSRPHQHDCEQLNYVMDGEIWIYVEGQPYHLHAGDFLRVPRMAVHWAWNQSDQDCILCESHAPGLELLPRDQTVDLLGAGESPDLVLRVPNLWVEYESGDADGR